MNIIVIVGMFCPLAIAITKKKNSERIYRHKITTNIHLAKSILSRFCQV